MTFCSGSIPQLMNGVSQQPASLRLPSQGEAQVNCMSSVVSGLGRRPPTEHLAKIYNGSIGEVYTHTINRDENEQYTVIIKNGDLYVYDMAGNQKTVSFPDGKTYLNSTHPKTDMSAFTLKDYTFILNKTKTCAMKSSPVSTAYANAAIIYVKIGENGVRYSVDINGIHNEWTANTVRTDIIADNLKTLIAADFPTWTVTCLGAYIHIYNTAGTAVNATAYGGSSGENVVAFTNSVTKFSDLPAKCSNNYLVRVAGSVSGAEDDYYVRFIANDPSTDLTEGTWVETVGPNIQYQIDPATMPYQLVRNSDGTFTFQQIDWDDRRVGDLNTNPDPSFIGATINDIFLFKDRLCFLSEENYICSEAGYNGFFNFFRTSVTTLLDSDPVDKSPDHTKVSILKYALPFSKTLLAFSDQTQFIDTTDGIMTPKSAALSPASEFASTLTSRPVGVGRNVYFPIERGDWTGVQELFVDSTYNTVDSADATAHIPQYIPNGVFKLTGSSNDNILLALTSQYVNRVYVNNFFFGPGSDGNLTKLQNAWHYWEFPTSDTILNADFINSIVYFVVQRSDGVYLEKMDVSEGAVDVGFRFRVHLDRKQSLTGVYNAGTNTTTWTLAGADTSTFMVVRGAAWTANAGLPILGISRPSSTTISASGDWSAQPCIVGRVFTSSYRFSEQFMKDQGNSVNLAQVQLRNFLVRYNKSGYFKMQVSPLYRDVFVYPFTARIIGSPENIIGSAGLESGDYKFPIYARSDQVAIDFISDSYLPAFLLSAEWEAGVFLRTKRI